MGVGRTATAAPNPLPPLLQWTTQANDLGSGPLQPGQTIKYKVELDLPTTAGNADHNRARSSTSSGAPRPDPFPASGRRSPSASPEGVEPTPIRRRLDAAVPPCAAFLPGRPDASFSGHSAEGARAALPLRPRSPRARCGVRGRVYRSAGVGAGGTADPAPPTFIFTTTTLTASPSAPQPGQTVMLTATVTAQSGSSAPPGSVSFSDGGSSLGSATLSPSGTTATATLTTTFPAGTHSLTASYTGKTDTSTNTIYNTSSEATRSPSPRRRRRTRRRSRPSRPRRPRC